MLKNIRKSIVIAAASLMMLAPGLIPAAASVAFADSISDSVCSGANSAADSTADATCSSTTNTTGLKTIAKKIVNVFSLVVGFVAVIMVIYGGFRYITSGGESGSVGNAKNTLIYAIVGLIIVALAQFIVHFALGQASTATTSAS